MDGCRFALSLNSRAKDMPLLTLKLGLLWAAAVLFCFVLLANSQPTAVRSFAYDSFDALDEKDFGVVFNTVFGPQTLQLTSYYPLGGEETLEIGAVWYKQRVWVDDFESTFTIRVSNKSAPGLGFTDGFAFVVQNARISSFGAAAGGVGYGSTPDYNDISVRSSVAIEFDTRMDAILHDPNNNHISVHYSQSVTHGHNSADEFYALSPPGAVTNIPYIQGNTHTFTVLYKNKNLRVFIDGGDPVYQAKIDFRQVFNLTSLGAFIGLTSSSGGTGEDVEVLNWSYGAIMQIEAANTYISNFTEQIQTGIPMVFLIHAIDTFGQPLQSCGDAARISLEFSSTRDHVAVKPTVQVRHCENGTYKVAVTAAAAGSFLVNITVDGKPIAGMPRTLLVISDTQVNVTDLCTITVQGSFADPQASSLPFFDRQHFIDELYSSVDSSSLSLSYLVLNESSTALYALEPNKARFTTSFSVLKNESSGAASRVINGVVAAVNAAVGGPFDSTEVGVKSYRTCNQPLVRRCAQVSAKLESGLPFNLGNSNDLEYLTRELQAALAANILSLGVASSVESIDVQSLAAVPLAEPDTLQVAVRVVLAVTEAKMSQADVAVGYAVTKAMNALVEVEGDTSFFEVAFTITPCHTPF